MLAKVWIKVSDGTREAKRPHGPTQDLQRGVLQADEGLGEGDGQGDVGAGVPEERALGQAQVEPQGLDVRGRAAQPGDQVLLQTRCDLIGQERGTPRLTYSG